MTTTSFVGGFSGGFSGEGSAGVASLDPPLLQQTKSEIRSLASEIARLAHSTIEPADFFSGFLPRLITAMGAEAAAVWQTSESLRLNGKLASDNGELEDATDSSVRLIAQHLLPKELLQSEVVRRRHDQYVAPSDKHQEILECVLAEGTPILVPPQTVTLETDRPVNPLAHSIIIVPVRIEENVEFLLEVVQPACGGPAAQRGYLRFVAQMADLLADYLRRQSLREHSRRSNRLQQFEYWLTSVAQTKHSSSQLRCVADAMADLLDSFQVLLLRSGRSPRVLAVSGLQVFDSRSETILLACAVEREIARATRDSRCEENAIKVLDSSGSDNQVPSGAALQAALASDRIVRARMDESGDLIAMLAYCEPSVVPPPAELLRVATSLAGLVDANAVEPDWVRKWWPFRFRMFGSNSKLKRSGWQTWSMRAALVGLLAAIAMFPVPQQITATAVLNAKSKTQYFAPFDANIIEVRIGDEQFVQKGEPLLTMASPALEKELQAMVSEADVLRERLKNLKLTISGSTSGERSNSMTAQRTELEAQLDSNRQQQQVLKAELAKREVFALATGRITTWDVHNRLTNLPVKFGQLLLTTIDPDGEWELQVSIPEYRVGLVSDALAQSPGEGVPLRFNLVSHPGVLLEGHLAALSDQAARNATGESVLIARAAIDGKQLPLKKEGAIARVTIDCGRVPAIWLVVRDAYWACMSRLKMIW